MREWHAVFQWRFIKPNSWGKRLALAQPPQRKTSGKRSLIWHLITHALGRLHERRQTLLSTLHIGIQILAFDMRCSGGRYTAPGGRHGGQQKIWGGILRHNITFLGNLSKINTLIISLLESCKIHYTFKWQNSFKHTLPSQQKAWANKLYVWNKKLLWK